MVWIIAMIAPELPVPTRRVRSSVNAKMVSWGMELIAQVGKLRGVIDQQRLNFSYSLVLWTR